jgi:hypothetical protein
VINSTFLLDEEVCSYLCKNGLVISRALRFHIYLMNTA